MRTILAKKFKIDDGSAKHVETATLLEPSNNNATSQNEHEELMEVATSLKDIKKKYDEEKKNANKKQEELDVIKSEINQLNLQEVQAHGPMQEVRQKLDMLN